MKWWKIVLPVAGLGVIGFAAAASAEEPATPPVKPPKKPAPPVPTPGPREMSGDVPCWSSATGDIVIANAMTPTPVEYDPELITRLSPKAVERLGYWWYDATDDAWYVDYQNPNKNTWLPLQSQQRLSLAAVVKAMENLEFAQRFMIESVMDSQAEELAAETLLTPCTRRPVGEIAEAEVQFFMAAHELVGAIYEDAGVMAK